jgi:hypothetical protein
MELHLTSHGPKVLWRRRCNPQGKESEQALRRLAQVPQDREGGKNRTYMGLLTLTWTARKTVSSETVSGTLYSATCLNSREAT